MAGIMRTLWDESDEIHEETLSTHNLLVDHPSNELDKPKESMLDKEVGDDNVLSDKKKK